MVTKIGIIGYRNHAQRLISLVDNDDKCELVCIFHPDKKIDDLRGTNNFSELLNCDVIIIASPNDTHFDYLMKLENFSGYILCEKPPAVNLKELDELRKIHSSRKSKIFFNFNYRFSNFNDILTKNLNTEEIGKIMYIEIISSQGLAFKQEYANSWRADGKNNRFNLLDTVTIHYIDLISHHFGKSKNQFYFPKLISKNGTSYDTGHLILEYDECSVSIFNSYATPLIIELNIIGSNGQLSIKNNVLEIKTPRDTFDEKQFFIMPPTSVQKKINMTEDYSLSLKKSFDFFISHVFEKRKIDEVFFETSLNTTDLILKLRNTKNEQIST